MAMQHLTGDCVAFDIETTGFAAAGGHEVTAVGFIGFDCGEDAGPEQALVLLQSGGREVDVQEVCDSVRAKLPDDVECIVGIEQDEEGLLEGVASIIESLDADQRLVGYNAEHYRGGFDFPFLRTRLHYHDLDWFFHQKKVLDVFPLVERFVNTTMADAGSLRKKEMKAFLDAEGVEYDSGLLKDELLVVIEEEVEDGALVSWAEAEGVDATGEQNDLSTAHEALFSSRGVDPVIDSETVVGAFQDGELETVALHCLADCFRVRDFTEFAEEYVLASYTERVDNRRRVSEL